MLKPCLGREALLDRVAAALTHSRWVTLAGPPGSGKSLIARHVVGEGHPCTWIDARGMRGAEEVLGACITALRLDPAPGDSPEGAITRALDGAEVVLVLDGLELDAVGAADLLSRLVDSTTDVRVLVTSLAVAGHPSERVVRVGPLPLPAARAPLSGPAVELFLGRLESAGGHPVDLARDERDVRRLLAATGGLPLLVEQAALQGALLGLANAAPSSSLAEAIGASYALLEPHQRRCLRRLALLPCPVGIDALAAVVEVGRAEARRLAAALARRSLVEVLADGRFDMLSPIRERVRQLPDADDGDGDDAAAVAAGLLRWADAVAPDHDNYGAADEPWLVDLAAMRHAVVSACAAPATRDLGYALANRIFSSLYTSMRARDAVEILEAVLTSGDGPAAIGAQVARRAGIAASEVRGSYEGLWLLDRADEHAAAAGRPAEQLARTASIRAEMHLDAGDLRRAEAEAERALDLEQEGGSIIRQATRTLADVYASSGRLVEATRAAARVVPGSDTNDERWITLSARTLLARVALEQGRTAEATAGARAVVEEARALAEDRVGLLAETMLRELDRDWSPAPVDRESLPWAVRLPVLTQDARDRFAHGDARTAAGLAADVVALADSARLGRDAVEARLLLGRALLAEDDRGQAGTTFLNALEDAARMPMPLRVADALDGLASVAQHDDPRAARALAAAAAAVRAPRHAVSWGYAASFVVEPARTPPTGWVVDGDLTTSGRQEVAAVFTGGATTTRAGGPFDVLTTAERQVADRVADGLTSRQIAEELVVSPRTVDAHLAHIYRKLEINSRARLAAMVVDQR